MANQKESLTAQYGEILTIEATSERLGISQRTLREKAKAGIIKAHKKAGRWLILHSDLIEWIRSGRD